VEGELTMRTSNKPSGMSDEIIIESIERKAIPSIEKNGMECVVFTRRTFQEMKNSGHLLPSGVEVLPRELHGPRVVVRERQLGIRMVTARWPNDAMEATYSPLLAFVNTGQADLRIGNYVLHCPEGTFVCMPPGIPHPDPSHVHLEGPNSATRSCDIIWMTHVGEVLRLSGCRSSKGEHIGVPSFYISQKNLSSDFERLFHDNHRRSPAIDRIRKSALTLLLSTIHHELHERRYFRKFPQVTTSKVSHEVDPIKNAQLYVRQHLSEDLTLESVARVAYLCRAQFAKKFHSQTGETFNEFVTRCRLEEAKMRLSTTPMEVGALSHTVGLTPRRLGQIFRAHTGMSPTEYRRKFADSK
jgi:AraC-like DNA-binding protein